jgi:hypothetical protein
MAESKSTCSASSFKAHSEKSANLDLFLINRLDADSECASRDGWADRPQPESPLCDCDYLDACTGSCLEPVGVPEDDLSFSAICSAARSHVCGAR